MTFVWKDDWDRMAKESVKNTRKVWTCYDCGKDVKINQHKHTCGRNAYWLDWECRDDIETLGLVGCKNPPHIIGRGVARR